MTSLIDEMGRTDPDLTPNHDKAMLWLEQYLGECGIDQLIDRFHGEGPPKLRHLHSNGGKYTRFTNHDLEAAIKTCPILDRGSHHKTIWEYPVSDGRLFLDMVVEITQRCPCRTGPAEKPWNNHPNIFQYGYEVKPQIYSIGQTLRQLKIYQRHFQAPIILVAPMNDDLKRIIMAEGFGIIALYGDFPK